MCNCAHGLFQGACVCWAQVYKAKDRTDRLWVEHWIDLLECISGATQSLSGAGVEVGVCVPLRQAIMQPGVCLEAYITTSVGLLHAYVRECVPRTITGAQDGRDVSSAVRCVHSTKCCVCSIICCVAWCRWRPPNSRGARALRLRLLSLPPVQISEKRHLTSSKGKNPSGTQHAPAMPRVRVLHMPAVSLLVPAI